jgi:hypothetical protein
MLQTFYWTFDFLLFLSPFVLSHIFMDENYMRIGKGMYTLVYGNIKCEGGMDFTT